jgi:hypothetical protein
MTYFIAVAIDRGVPESSRRMNATVLIIGGLAAGPVAFWFFGSWNAKSPADAGLLVGRSERI